MARRLLELGRRYQQPGAAAIEGRRYGPNLARDDRKPRRHRSDQNLGKGDARPAAGA
jgi:hypothetical protein